MSAFFILLREGLEALLVVAAIIAFLRKADRPEVGFAAAILRGRASAQCEIGDVDGRQHVPRARRLLLWRETHGDRERTLSLLNTSLDARRPAWTSGVSRMQKKSGRSRALPRASRLLRPALRVSEAVHANGGNQSSASESGFDPHGDLLYRSCVGWIRRR